MRVKMVLASLVVMALVLILAGKGFAFQNEPDGFRGLKWGDPPTENMMPFLDEPQVYVLLVDKMSMGSVELYLIAYRFYDQPERFEWVALYFRGEGNFDLLKTICQGKFGEATKEGYSKLEWLGPIAFVLLQYDRFEKEGYLAIGSTQITTEDKKAQEQKEIEEAEKDW